MSNEIAHQREKSQESINQQKFLFIPKTIHFVKIFEFYFVTQFFEQTAPIRQENVLDTRIYKFQLFTYQKSFFLYSGFFLENLSSHCSRFSLYFLQFLIIFDVRVCNQRHLSIRISIFLNYCRGSVFRIRIRVRIRRIRKFLGLQDPDR